MQRYHFPLKKNAIFVYTTVVMELGEEIVLRPRFSMDLKTDAEHALQAFEAVKHNSEGVVVTRWSIMFLKIPKHLQHFWSPQLDLEITSFEAAKLPYADYLDQTCGMDLFMFLHFAVASLFIAFGIWAYTNATLKSPYLPNWYWWAIMVLVLSSILQDGWNTPERMKCKTASVYEANASGLALVPKPA